MPFTPFLLRTLALLLVTLPIAAPAVVIVSGDGSGNTTSPGDDPGFSNVGRMGAGGAVYLGNRWILTVAHLSTAGGTAIFGGTTYGFVSGTETRLSNPSGSGLSGVIDLRMIRLDGDPSLPSMTVASAAPSAGEDVIMIGRGRLRAPAQTHWTVTPVPDPDPDVWTEAGASVDREGFTTSGVRNMRWGENEVDDDSLVVDAGWGETQSFSTKFDQTGGMVHEAQAVAGDSGGGVFAKRGGLWELIGIMHTVTNSDGQPANTAVYDNDTNSADLSFYAAQINALVATPEPSTSLLVAAGLVLCLRRRR